MEHPSEDRFPWSDLNLRYSREVTKTIINDSYGLMQSMSENYKHFVK